MVPVLYTDLRFALCFLFFFLEFSFGLLVFSLQFLKWYCTASLLNKHLILNTLHVLFFERKQKLNLIEIKSMNVYPEQEYAFY